MAPADPFQATDAPNTRYGVCAGNPPGRVVWARTRRRPVGMPTGHWVGDVKRQKLITQHDLPDGPGPAGRRRKARRGTLCSGSLNETRKLGNYRIPSRGKIAIKLNCQPGPGRGVGSAGRRCQMGPPRKDGPQGRRQRRSARGRPCRYAQGAEWFAEPAGGRGPVT